MDKPKVFMVKEPFFFKTDVTYSVYGENGRLYFIKVGGQSLLPSGDVEVNNDNLGLLGYIIAPILYMFMIFYNQKRVKKLHDKIIDDQKVDLKILLGRNACSFHMSRGQISRSAVTAPKDYRHNVNSGNGITYGKFEVEELSGKKRTFQFESIDEMRIAIEMLPDILGASFKNKTQWNKSEFRYDIKEDI